jgi:[ribosomal protein S5]-alanine N-acetyltransferase
MPAPATLETARLVLRPLRAEDLDALHAELGSDPQVTWDRIAHTREETRATLEAKLRHQDEHGFGMLAVVDREDGRVLGYGGLQHLEGGPEVEVGYYLGRRAWGRGLGTELARAAVAHGFADLGLERIVAVVRPENAASQRVLGKAGLRFERRERHYGADVELWSLDRATWASAAAGRGDA